MCLVYFPIYPTHIYTYYLIFLIFELRHKMMIPCYCIHLFLPCFAFPWFAPHRANRVTRQAQTREPRQPMSQGCAKTAPWIPPPAENDPVVIGTQQWSNDSNDALGCTVGVFLICFYGSPIGEALTQNFATCRHQMDPKGTTMWPKWLLVATHFLNGPLISSSWHPMSESLNWPHQLSCSQQLRFTRTASSAPLLSQAWG